MFIDKDYNKSNELSKTNILIEEVAKDFTYLGHYKLLILNKGLGVIDIWVAGEIINIISEPYKGIQYT